MGLAKVKRSYIRRNGGSVARGVPRIYNFDKQVAIYGYTEVNHLSTSVLGRVKINKAFLYCNPGEVSEGDLIIDKQENSYFLVMSASPKMIGYEIVYYDLAVVHCTDLITISRFGDGVRDSFGRVIDDAPQVIASGVRAMAMAQNYDVMEQQDLQLERDKIMFYLQSKHGIKRADRITTDTGRTYLVNNVDEISMTWIDIAYVTPDSR